MSTPCDAFKKTKSIAEDDAILKIISRVLFVVRFERSFPSNFFDRHSLCCKYIQDGVYASESIITSACVTNNNRCCART